MRLLVTLALAMLMAVSPAGAQTYPRQTVNIVVPLPPGSIPDMLARLLADKLSKKWASPVVVINRPGAGLNIGARSVATAEPDGYTLLLTAPGPLVTNDLLYANLGYDPRAFVPISILAHFGFVLVVRPDLDASNLRELVGYIRSRPDQLFFGSTGPASPPHLISEMFQKAVGVKMTPVAYPGLTHALNDVLGRRIDMMFYDVGDALPFIRDGKLKAIATTEAERVAELPNVPAIGEEFAGFSASSWFALMAPPRTPLEIANRLSSEVKAILQDEQVGSVLKRVLMTPMGLTPAETEKYLASEVARWREVILSVGLKPQ